MVLQSSGPISFSQIRNEFGGPPTQGAISISQYKNGGTYGSQIASNPNNIPSSNSILSFSKFYSAAKWTYPLGTYAAVSLPSSSPGATNQDANSKSIWIDPLQHSVAPIVNYPINFYYIFQNTTGSDIPGTIYEYQDDTGVIYLNNSVIGNYSFSGTTNIIQTTFKVGQNLLRGYITNVGGPGYFQLTFKNASGGTITYTDTNWYADARCLLHQNNWTTSMTATNIVGTQYSISGSDPDKQIQLGFQTGGTMNLLYYSGALIGYSSFTLYFEIYIGSTSGADGLYAFFGSNSLGITEKGGANAFTLTFQIYTGDGLSQGIYLINGSGTAVSTYLTSGFIASSWQPVYISYTKGTIDTWKIKWNGIDVISYSNPNNSSFIANAGTLSGIGFRDGGIAGTAYVRRIQLYHKA
jgi:hypothetical protein